jgi:GGDEF domain-containing protein
MRPRSRGISRAGGPVAGAGAGWAAASARPRGGGPDAEPSSSGTQPVDGFVVTSSLAPALGSPNDLLPGPPALLDRLTDRLADPSAGPASLAVIGLLRRDDGWPTAAPTLTTVTALLAGGMRGDDWLAREGQAEFAVLIQGTPEAAETAVTRLVRSVGGVFAGIAAAAGVVALEQGLPATEIRRRALVCLAAARTQGAGSLVRYRGNR